MISVNELQAFCIEHSEPGMEFTVRRDEPFTILTINGRTSMVYNPTTVDRLPHDVKLMQDGYLYCSGHVTKNNGR